MANRFKFLRTFRQALLIYDYKVALEKIFFTVAGILIALWVNQCAEKRKQHRTELASVIEIKYALQADLEDIKQTIEGFDISNYSQDYVLKSLKTAQEKPDSFNYHMGNCFANTLFLPNTAAYETLKSRGLETITDDSIRIAIANIYNQDYVLRKSSDERHNVFVQQQVTPFIIEKFYSDPISGGLGPYHYEAIQQDSALIHFIQYNRRKSTQLSQSYLRLKKKLEALCAKLDEY